MGRYLLVVFVLISCSSARAWWTSDPGIQQWQVKDGESLQAKLLQYEPSSKTIRLAKDGDSLPNELELSDLDLSGKIQALTHPNFFNQAQYSRSDFGILSILTVIVWTLIVVVSVIFVFLLAYQATVRLVIKAKDRQFNTEGFKRLFFIYLFFFILGSAIVVTCLLALKSNPDLGRSAAGLCATIICAITLLFTLSHFKKYHSSSTLRSALMIVVYGFVATLFLAAFVSAVGGLAYCGYRYLPGFSDGLLTHLVLKPIGLV